MMNSKDSNCSNYSIDIIKANWFDLLDKWSVNIELSKTLFAALKNKYSEKHRAYHNLNHISHILNSIEQIKHKSENIDALYFAAWYHDYIYNPQALDNEAKSAICACKALERSNVDAITIETVRQIILSTKSHKPLIKSIDNAIFLDLDLAILGASSEQYKKYSQAIGQEYKYLSDRDYCQGRKKILNQFLNRERIYYTDYFYQKLELTARENIKTEIKQLSFPIMQ